MNERFWHFYNVWMYPSVWWTFLCILRIPLTTYQCFRNQHFKIIKVRQDNRYVLKIVNGVMELFVHTPNDISTFLKSTFQNNNQNVKQTHFWIIAWQLFRLLCICPTTYEHFWNQPFKFSTKQQCFLLFCLNNSICVI